MIRVQVKSYIVQKAEKRYSFGFILLKMVKEDLQGIYFIGKTKVRDAWNFFTEKAKMRYSFVPNCT